MNLKASNFIKKCIKLNEKSTQSKIDNFLLIKNTYNHKKGFLFRKEG